MFYIRTSLQCSLRRRNTEADGIGIRNIQYKHKGKHRYFRAFRCFVFQAFSVYREYTKAVPGRVELWTPQSYRFFKLLRSFFDVMACRQQPSLYYFHPIYWNFLLVCSAARYLLFLKKASDLFDSFPGLSVLQNNDVQCKREVRQTEFLLQETHYSALRNLLCYSKDFLLICTDGLVIIMAG